MTVRSHTLLPLALLVLSLPAAGCAEKKLAIFDKPAIDEVHTLVIIPFQSPQDASAGPVVSGLVGVHLESSRLVELSVLEAPVLWRLTAADSPATAAAISDEAAMRIAREMGADAVLTGTVTYSIQYATPGNMPAGMKSSMKGGDFQRKFAVRKGTVSVNLRILSIKANRAIYSHTGSAGGPAQSTLLSKAFRIALKPFEDYVRSSREKK